MTNNIPLKYKSKIATAMGIIGSIKSEKKAKASRRNGKKGGRPIDPKSMRQILLKNKLTKAN